MMESQFRGSDRMRLWPRFTCIGEGFDVKTSA
jgi:hypothetical protein